MNNLHPLFNQLLRPVMPTYDRESESRQESQDKAIRQVSDGDFEFDDLMEGIRRYWPQIKKCLSDREDDEAHTFIMRGLVNELAEKEDE